MADETNKKGLGRGLMSLFGDQEVSINKEVELSKKVDSNSSYLLVPISELKRNRFQPRTFFNEQKIDELSQSIKKKMV